MLNSTDIRDCLHQVNKDNLFTDEEKKRLEEVKQRKQAIQNEIFEKRKEYHKKRYLAMKKQKELINGGNIC